MPSPRRRPNVRRRPRWLATGAAFLVLLLVAVSVFLLKRIPFSPSNPPAGAPSTALLEPQAAVFAAYAGSATCRECHPDAFALWTQSHHGLAERNPNPQLDLAAFEPARSYQHASQEVSVSHQPSQFLVNCLGLSGSNETHAAIRVLGHYPLRQFLVPFPGGRLQTLQASYDPRTNDWFDVYGAEDRRPGEWGHWTGRGMNWNAMCAGCHNTRVRKNYDPASDTYATAMAEMSVGCESCHGPLKAHVHWQTQPGRPRTPDPTVTRFTRAQILDNCGFCHARRSDLTGDFKPGDSFFDHQSLALVDHSDQFYPDGQVRDENYEFSAFLGSRMFTNGVYCLDCHNPHSAKTILPGNWLCLRCHNGSYPNAPAIDPVAHSHHRVFGYTAQGVVTNTDLLSYNPQNISETGGECVNCHMPQTVYMQRHWRHDHGFTIPDPLLTKEAGIPNACNRCHQDKSVDWAIQTCDSWYGPKMERHTRTRARLLAQARRADDSAIKPLTDWLKTPEGPYWRGVIVNLLGRWVAEPAVHSALIEALSDPHPLVREQAAMALGAGPTMDGSQAGHALRRALADPSLNVRLSAAWALRGQVPPDARARRELEHFLALNSDQPTGQMQQGAYNLALGHAPLALNHYRKAVEWDPGSAPIRHDLAVALSATGQTREALRELESAARLDPREAEYPFKMGLAWSELNNLPNAIAALERAVQLEPRHARAWYNLGLALSAGNRSQPALDALARAEALRPSDPQVPYARASILAAQGRVNEARQVVERALEIAPEYPEARRLLDQLSTPAR